VFSWLEAEPSVQGISVFSESTGRAATLTMAPEQLATVTQTAKQYVCYIEGFRFRADSPTGQEIVQILEDGAAHAVLVGRGGKEQGEAIQLSREGDPFRSAQVKHKQTPPKRPIDAR
jgi:hypothetical protein